MHTRSSSEIQNNIASTWIPHPMITHQRTHRAFNDVACMSSKKTAITQSSCCAHKETHPPSSPKRSFPLDGVVQNCSNSSEIWKHSQVHEKTFSQVHKMSFKHSKTQRWFFVFVTTCTQTGQHSSCAIPATNQLNSLAFAL